MIFSRLIAASALFSVAHGAVVTRTASDFNLTWSVIIQVAQGGPWQFQINGPSQSFFKYQPSLTAPNGTVVSLGYETDFETGNSTTDNPTLPTNRTCQSSGNQLSLNVNKVLDAKGTWLFGLDVVYYYGKDGYEYDNVFTACISPPFTSEKHTSNPVSITVTDSSPSGGLTPVLGSPTPVLFSTDFTGAPYATGITTTQSASTSTGSSSVGTPNAADMMRPRLGRGKLRSGSVVAVIFITTYWLLSL